MRFGTALSLALGLLGADPVAASRCKPRSSSESTDAISTISSEATFASTSTSTSAELSTITTSDTSSDTAETSTTELSSSATESTSVELSTTTTTSAPLDTTETSSTESSSIASTTTSSEPDPVITNFNIIADGGSADGFTLGRRPNQGSLQFSESSDWVPAKLYLEEGTGYLKVVDPTYPIFPLVCLRWGTGTDPTNPGWFTYCKADQTNGNMVHPITCELKKGGRLSCTTGAGHCRYYEVPPRMTDGWDCQADDGTYTGFYTESASDDGLSWFNPWMGFEGYEGSLGLEPLNLRWQSAD
ncbi:hypothetical protein FALBO_14983 [Fusarium albosuccineum]|uniref:Uncharacterized protein n=1 Tax=Fusarium albosuccineum TaxID=1237068 RepID=A0A8H4KX13_9HYPO|nr:hypothetical protein FALBO_14983 [Fusarium albosuccineum]